MSKKITTTSKAFRFSPEELALLEAAAEEYGNYKEAVMAGLYALKGRRHKAVMASVARELEGMAKQIRDGLK